MTKPVIILVSPQLGENIGAAARAMHNFGLNELRLVNPRDGWPSQSAIDVARNSKEIIDTTKIYNSLKDAVSDIHILYATTARPRDMVKVFLTPRKCSLNIRTQNQAGKKSAIMFGPERTGLNNDEIILADAIVTIPANNDNTSLNLAQAVSVLCYEWFLSGDNTEEEMLHTGESELATKAEITMLLETLEGELDKVGFFHGKEMRARMLRNISNIFTRNNLTYQEVKTLRGIIRNLSKT